MGKSLTFLLLAIGLIGCAGNDGLDKLVFGEGKQVISVKRGDFGQVALRVDWSKDHNPDETLFEAQAYLQAQDRFFQMDVLRRAATGRLAELFGVEALETDVETMGVGLLLGVERTVERLKSFPETSAILRGYAKGVNRYIDEIGQKNPDLLRFYERLTGERGYRPLRWEPRDSIAIAKGLAFLLSSQLEEKALMTAVWAYFTILRGDSSRIYKLVDTRPMESISILPTDRFISSPGLALTSKGKGSSPFDGLLGKPDQWAAYECPKRKFGSFPLGDPCAGLSIPGSNNWVVSREFAGGDSAIIANDPHLPLTFPSLFYEMALNSTAVGGSFYCRGLNVLGVPGILIGHNRFIAWALTNNRFDSGDIYLERIIPGVDKVRYRGKNYDLEKKEYTFLVRGIYGSLREVKKILRIHPFHGPIFSDHSSRLRKSVIIPMSYRWTGHEGTTEILAITKLNRASNFDEFKDALDSFQVGAQNFVYGDLNDNIGYYSHALVPDRSSYLSDDFRPYLGVQSDGNREWADDYQDGLPFMKNPEKGFIVTANNDPRGLSFRRDFFGYKDYYGYGYSLGVRAKRITQLLEQNKGKIDVGVMNRIQRDTKDLFAERTIQIVADVEVELTLSEKAKALVSRLKTWSRTKGAEVSSVYKAPFQFYLWYFQLQKEYYRQFFFADGGSGNGSEALFIAFNKNALAIRSLFHHVTGALEKDDQRGAMLRIIEKSLEKAVVLLGENQLEQKRWGQMHRLRFFSLIDKFFPSLVNYPLEIDGSMNTINMGGFKLDWLVDSDEPEYYAKLPNMQGPCFRLIMTLNKNGIISGYNVIPGGSRGSWNDQAKKELLMWRNGELRPLVPFL